MHGRPITVYGRGDAIRDFTYIADVVDGVVAALSLNATGAEVVNLGNDRPVRLMPIYTSLYVYEQYVYVI